MSSAHVAQRAGRAAAARPAAGLLVLVVPHTHWDREWYATFRDLRVRMTRTLDEVLAVLERDPRMRFTMDGQAVLIEDYLEMRPEASGRLRRALAGGRLSAGPSYVLPDEYLVGPESLVRNLLAGRRVVRAAGGRESGAGYAPDTFGHVAQLPQVLRGFGIDNLVFTRGLGDEAEGAGPVMRWRGPDGSEVLAVRQLAGYGNADHLGRQDVELTVVDDPRRALDAADGWVRDWLRRQAAEHEAGGLRLALLCNGVDHRRVQPELPELLDALSGRLGGTWRIASYDDYLALVRRRAARDGLPQLTGELDRGRFHTVTRGVNSARMWIKQEAEAAERELVTAETLAVLACLRAPYPYDWAGEGRPNRGFPDDQLRLGWRELLRTHPHDSIGGCSIDEVHEDMRARFADARGVAARVRRESLSALAGREARWLADEPAAEVTLVNPLPFARRAAVALDPPPHLRRARGLVAHTPEGPLPVQWEDHGEHRRAVVLAEVAGLDDLPVRLAPGRAPAPDGAARVTGPRTIENGALRVQVEDDGTLTVTDLVRGEVHRGQHRIDDVGDRGDVYNFCALDGDAPAPLAGPVRVRPAAPGPLVAALLVEAHVRAPRALDRTRTRRVGRAELVVRTTVRLVAGGDRVEIEDEVVNGACDHRLRVRFPAPGAGDRVRVEGHWAVVDRPAQPGDHPGWREPPQTTHHTLGAVAAGAVTVVGVGLPEYEAVPDGAGGLDLAVTLLRCVGWLSRDDFPSRPYHAGPMVPTPLAQMPGRHRFRMALRPGPPPGAAGLLRLSQDVRTGLEVAPAGARAGGLMRLDGEGWVLGALKGAEDGEGFVLRVVNPGPEPGWLRVDGRVRDLARCRLDETPARRVPDAGRVPVPPFTALTLRMRAQEGTAP